MKTKFFTYMSFVLIFSVFNPILHAQGLEFPKEDQFFNAVNLGNSDGFLNLLNEGVDVNARGDMSLNTPLHVVCRNTNRSRRENIEIQEACGVIAHGLLDADADPNAKNRLGQTPLQALVSSYSVDYLPLSVLERIILNTVDGVTVVDNGGNGLLHQIVRNDDISEDKKLELIDYFLDQGVDIDAANSDNLHPIYLAFKEPRVFYHLLDAGAYLDVTLAGEDGSTYLHRSVLYRQFPSIAELLREGADPNAANAQGQTALHLATTESSGNFYLTSERRGIQLEIVFLLIQYGGDIHAMDREGWTPYLQMVAQDDRELYRDFVHFVTHYGSIMLPGSSFINFNRAEPNSEEVSQEQR